MFDSFTLISGPKLLFGSAVRRVLASLQEKNKIFIKGVSF